MFQHFVLCSYRPDFSVLAGGLCLCTLRTSSQRPARLNRLQRPPRGSPQRAGIISISGVSQTGWREGRGHRRSSVGIEGGGGAGGTQGEESGQEAGTRRGGAFSCGHAVCSRVRLALGRYLRCPPVGAAPRRVYYNLQSYTRATSESHAPIQTTGFRVHGLSSVWNPHFRFKD